jgi:streptomycin 6-kinase
MPTHPVHPSPTLRSRAEHIGDLGLQWLEALPNLVTEFEQHWAITVGEPLPGANEGYVARAEREDGTPAVLKLNLPLDYRRSQVDVLEQAQGNGYAKAYAVDRDRQALLLEALGPTLSSLEPDPERRISVLAAVLTQAWTVPVDEATLWFGERKATDLAGIIEKNWRVHGKPCSAKVVDLALRYAERRAAAHEPDRCVYAHGDPHAGNALRVDQSRPGAEAGFVFIDPDGGAIEPAYDLGVILRDWDAEIAASRDPLAFTRHLCTLLADATGEDWQAIWEWGFIERVATGLWVLEFGQDWGHDKLANAERLVCDR